MLDEGTKLAPRKGDWMMTYTGRKFWPLDPYPADIDLTDIAWALSHQCRYNGHGRFFYSVAEHCWHLAQLFISEGKIDSAMAALMHDASEAYLGDCVRPLKRSLPQLAEIERHLDDVIWRRFRLKPMADVVKDYDDRILADERNVLFDAAVCEAQGWRARGGLGIALKGWPPTRVFSEFMACADALGIR